MTEERLDVLTAEQLRSALVRKAERDPDFRARLLADPNAAIEDEFGITVPDGFNVEVHEETSTDYHVVLPALSQLSHAEMMAISAGGQRGSGNTAG